MKQWLETRQVLDRLAELLSEGRRAALATVVRVRGSAYRHEGAKMLVDDQGATTGNVSGGCLEADVREVAHQVIAANALQRSEYCAGSDEVSAWDLGVGCEGSVDVLVQPVDAQQPALELARRLLDGDESFALCTDLASGRRLAVTANETAGDLDGAVATRARSLLADGASGIQTIADHEVFIDVFVPPPQLVIVSAGDDAVHLARIAAAVGFRVVVADRRPGLLTPSRFPATATLVESDADALSTRLTLDDHTYAVVMTHNYADDRAYLRALLASAVAYIGMLGPRQRTERLLAELSAQAPVNEDRVYGPVGLDIGTDGAEQVALSVVGEILAVRSGRRPASLRERRVPIHAVASD